MIEALIFDLDQTLIESQHIEPLRRMRNWHAVYQKIPTIQAYDGINELLSIAVDADIELAIVTSSPETYVQKVVDQFNWAFDAKVCYHDTTQHKPDPAPFVEALNRLTVDAVDCWAIGDDSRDIIAARAAGMYSVGALWGSVNRQSLASAKPDILFESVASLSKAIRNLIDPL
jgi:HAD superfamily hydrolase (TIGR01549 family)